MFLNLFINVLVKSKRNKFVNYYAGSWVENLKNAAILTELGFAISARKKDYHKMNFQN